MNDHGGNKSAQGGTGETPDVPHAACNVCPHGCTIPDGRLGICGARSSEDGMAVDLNYGRATALALDPIEKKPFALYRPGSLILSYGSYGCNLRCPFCQNADISMADASSGIHTRFVSPEELASNAEKYRPQGNIGVALTYNEPLIAPEYLCALGPLLKDRGLDLAVVTNGYAAKATIDKVAPYIDAANVDLKCFSEEGYQRLGAPQGLEAVENTIASFVRTGVHVEVTTLVVPGLSDDLELFREECTWLSDLSPDIPLHLTRFFPSYKIANERPTDRQLLLGMRAIARECLKYVYVGNL